MKKINISGRILMAVLLCAVLLTNMAPSVVYATDGYQKQVKHYRTIVLSSDGIVDTQHDYDIYGREDDKSKPGYEGHFSTDISDQMKGKVEKENLLTILKNSYEQNYAVDLISSLIYLLASSLHLLFDEMGIGLDNIIFGRVGGNGVRVSDGDTTNYSYDDIVVSLFHFELESGNPYGVIAAMIYNAIRKYMYIIMIVVAFAMFAKLAMKSDIPLAKLDFKNKLFSLMEIFALMIFMPYFLEIGLYVRDILLKGIVGDSMLDMFGSAKYGILNTFKDNCNVSFWSDAPSLISSILYFAAVCVSLVLAAMYVANALAMLVQVVAFPIVCIKTLFDKRALGSWVMEVIGLAAVPVIDGTLFLVPLLFAKASNGAVGLNFVSLLMCGSMLTVRQQFRKAIGLASNNMLEAGGLMTAMGMARLISSVGRAGKRAIGQAAGGFKQGASDDAMATYYDVQAKQDEFNQKDAEAQIDNGYFNSRGGVGENPAAKTGMGAGMGLGGDLSYKSQKLNDINKKLSTPHETSADNVHVADITNQSPSEEQAKRTQDLRDAQVATILGKKAPVKDNVADEFATIDNFESQEFANKLSNAKKAQLYRERAKHARAQGIKSSLVTAGGAIAGGITGFAATAYMDSGTSAMITSAGVDLGASAGGAVSSIENMKRLSDDAKKDRTVEGEGSELGYTIKTAEDGAHLYTYSRFNDKEPEKFAEAFVDFSDLPATSNVKESAGTGEMVTTEGWYETNGAKIVDAYETAETVDGPRLAGPQVDKATGEYYYSVDGRVIYGNDATDNVVTVEESTMGSRERFANIMNQNSDFKDFYVQELGDAVQNVHLSKSVEAYCDDNHRMARTEHAQMSMDVNLTPSRKNQGNRKISSLKDETISHISSLVSQPIMKEVQDYVDNPSKSISMTSEDYNAIGEITKEFANSAANDYLEAHGYHFDELIIR